jgi:hypothetical protein
MHMKRALAMSGVAAVTLITGASPAAADTVARGQASSYGATIEVGGEAVVPPTPTASVTAPPPGTASNTVIDIPADPLAVSGTLTAAATVHQASDIPTSLTVVQQQVAGPYNATATSLVEGLRVLLDVPEAGLALLSADAVRSEAAAVCTAGVQYTAASEIIDLRVGGEVIPLNAPVQDLIDAISGVLADTGLNQVVDVQRNVVTPTENGISVDALVVTVLAAAGDTPVGRVVIGHAEVSAAQCGTMPQCSDGEDNDGDGQIDHPNDPDCDSPEDPSEFPECSDDVDNADAEDELADEADPGCHSDGDAGNPDSYVATDDDETDDVGTQPQTQTQGPSLARTGGESALALAAVLGALGLAGLALRRRSLI